MTIPVVATLLIPLLCGSASNSAQNDIVLETNSFSLDIATDGHVAHVIDRVSNIDYCNTAAHLPFSTIRRDGRIHPASKLSYSDNQLTATFDGVEGQVIFRVERGDCRLAFEVTSMTCDKVEELVFAQVPLTLQGIDTEPFGLSPLALNLQTNCQEIPGLSSGMSGFIACKRFGFDGASGAIIGAPMDKLRDALKKAVQSSPDLVASPLGGPWALDAKSNQSSYLITASEAVTASNVNKWIDTAIAVGAEQIDFHGEKAFRWGDYEVNPTIYPNGRASVQDVVSTVHKAGMAAGLHTFAFFIAKDTPWVTPVPDPRLDSDAVFTLAGDTLETDTTLTVLETTEAMSTVTGFAVFNSVTLRIDDELITYAALGKQSPYTFSQCTRGAYGTRAAAHRRGTKAYHLKECFGLFVPQGDSDLFTEVAQKTADLYNACDFDMLYLDALDGVGIIAGGENGWHYAAKFAYEVARRLKKPAVMEMSSFSHHLWTVRSRMEAWDCPARGVKDFADLHALRNLRWKAAFLPTHMGWWGTFDWAGIQPERTFPDDLEYVCTKALATDSSLSYIAGFTPDELTRGNAQRLAAIAKKYEHLRRSAAVPSGVKKMLAEAGKDFTLVTEGDDHWQFYPTNYFKHTMNGQDSVSMNNPFPAQPLLLRIESLLNAAPFDSEKSSILASPGDTAEFGSSTTQQGVTATLEKLESNEHPGAYLRATNTAAECDRAWVALCKQFAAPVNLTDKGLGVWIEGDGQGEVLNIQVKSPAHLGGGQADHYVHIDFTGWRYCELVEPESAQLALYEWAHTRRKADWPSNPSAMAGLAYPMYHVWVDYSQIASLTLGLNNIPAGKSVRVGVGTIKAVPLLKGKLVQPSVILNGNALKFPVTLESGCYLEYLAQDNCKVYDARGECITNVVPVGSATEVKHGENSFALIQEGEPVRKKITVITRGEPLDSTTTSQKPVSSQN